jgi:hypothetical protein
MKVPPLTATTTTTAMKGKKVIHEVILPYNMGIGFVPGARHTVLYSEHPAATAALNASDKGPA